MTDTRPTIHLDGHHLDFDEVRQTLNGPIQVDIAAAQRTAVESSRATIESMLDSSRPIYGVNTGFGRLANVRISEDRLAELQVNLVRSHAAGVGDPLPPSVVRLVLLLKIVSLCRGYSGVRWAVIEQLAALLRHDLMPVVPEQGSVGASGDLAPLAHVALLCIGEGEAWFEGERVPGRDALRRCDLEPLELQAKEGLALLNGTQVSTALALRGLLSAERNVKASLLAGALSVDAVKGSDAPFDPRIHAVRPHAGQAWVASHIRRLMAGSEIRASHVDCDHVQDPYSFRCQPQVLGAVLDLLRSVAGTLRTETNAVSDNPLVFPDAQEVVSGGNFHAEPVAFAADILALAVAETGAISERRLSAMVDPALSELPAFLATDPGIESGYMIAQVTAAALASENKQLAHPASVDSLPTSANQEDHVSMATHAALRLGRMNANTRRILAIELMAAADGIDLRRPLRSSTFLEEAHAAIRRIVPRRTGDREFGHEIEAVACWIGSGEIEEIIALDLDALTEGRDRS